MFSIFRDIKEKILRIKKVSPIMKTLLQWREEHENYKKKNKRETIKENKKDEVDNFIFIIEKTDFWEE